jgi:hypothetical protein
MARILFIIQEPDWLDGTRSLVDSPVCKALELSSANGDDDESRVVNDLIVDNHRFDVF